MSFEWYVRCARRHLGVVRRAGHAGSLPEAKAAVELAVRLIGTAHISAEVRTPRGTWTYRPHGRIAGRMVWERP